MTLLRLVTRYHNHQHQVKPGETAYFDKLYILTSRDNFNEKWGSVV